MTSISASTPEYFSAFPMGPKLRSYLGLSPAADDLRYLQRDPGLDTSLVHYLRSQHDLAAEPLTSDAVVDLLDEMLAMDLPEAALDLAAARPDVLEARDFRAELAVGVAAMLVGRLEDAEKRLRAAQQTLPAEPAPYVNLAQIFLSQDRLDEAELWCLTGLDAEPNHYALWDLLAEILRDRYGEYMPERLLQLAEKRCAWAGLSLAANLTTTGDRYLKANLLERLYAQGERNAEFLVELTGAFGISGDFAKIPAIVFQAERATTKGLPWQLHVHCGQAQLALGQVDACLQALAKARHDDQLPPEARAGLSELEEEALASRESSATSLPN